MTTLVVPTGTAAHLGFPVSDYRDEALTSVDVISFDTVARTTALFLVAQIGGGGIDTTATIVGDARANTLGLAMNDAGVFDFEAATNFTLSNWTDGQDFIGLFGSSGADTIFGSAGSDYITGEIQYQNFGDDVLHGRGGDDILEGRYGRDELYGEDGDDTLVTFESGDGEVFSGGAGVDTLSVERTGVVEFRNATVSSIEVLNLSGFDGFSSTFTTQFSAAQLGAGLSNALVVHGGTLRTADQVSISGSGGNIDVSGWSFVDWNSNDSVRLNGTAVSETFIGSSRSDTLMGYGGADILESGAGNDRLFGGGGADTLDGGAGGDFMFGGSGADTYIVDSTTDIAREEDEIGRDLVKSSVSWTLEDRVESVWLTGSANTNALGNALDNALAGNAGNNVLSGLEGADKLSGGAGNDDLKGGGGHDTLTGAAGKDHFIFASINAADSDVVTDFAAADDTIYLDNAALTQVGANGALAVEAFWINTTGLAHDGDDRIIYNSSTGKLYYDADGNGAGAGVLLATLAGHPPVTLADFVVI